MLNCSHTHNAPLTAPWGPWLKDKDLSFHRFLPERLTEITKKAVENLTEVRAFTAREPFQIGFNRRLVKDGKVIMAGNPDGAVIPWVDVLGFVSKDDVLVASLFTHAAHPVIVHDTSKLISGDYPGFAVQQVKRKAKRGIHLFFQGCAGNINAFPLKGGLDAAMAAGRELGDAAYRGLTTSSPVAVRGSIKSASLDLKLPLRPPPPAAELREIIAKEKNAGKRARRERLLEIAESGKVPSMEMPMRVFKIGDVSLLAMAHEPFAEYQHFLEKHSPFSCTMAFGYTNGLECYVGTETDYLMADKGGYETSPYGAALMFESRLPLAPKAEGIIQKGLIELLKKVE